MGSKGREIVKLDVNDLIEKLNIAFADEWLAFYQYWIGSKLVSGPMKKDVAHELIEHANDELNHAHMIAERICQLGGTPLISPDQWKETATCGYKVPDDKYVIAILDQSIASEQCAIEVYNNLLQFTEHKDPITYNLILEILKDEVEHEDEFQALKKDIELIKKL